MQPARRPGGSAAPQANVASFSGARPQAAALPSPLVNHAPRPPLWECSEDALLTVVEKAMDAKLLTTVKEVVQEELAPLRQQLTALEELKPLRQQVTALARATGANAESAARATKAVCNLPGYWPPLIMHDGEPQLGPVCNRRQQVDALPCACLHLPAHHACMQSAHASGTACLAAMWAACVHPVSGPAPSGSACANAAYAAHAAQLLLAPCAAHHLLEWMATGGHPAELEAVLDEVVAEHRGYLKLRQLLLHRLTVRQGASGRLGCERRQELPDAWPFPDGKSNQRQCEQGCTTRG